MGGLPSDPTRGSTQVVFCDGVYTSLCRVPVFLKLLECSAYRNLGCGDEGSEPLFHGYISQLWDGWDMGRRPFTHKKFFRSNLFRHGGTAYHRVVAIHAAYTPFHVAEVVEVSGSAIFFFTYYEHKFGTVYQSGNIFFTIICQLMGSINQTVSGGSH